MIFQTQKTPARLRVRFAWWPIVLERRDAGERIWLWLEPFTREVTEVGAGSSDAWITVTRIKTGERFTWLHPLYWLESTM